jgi:hypothetical protein
MLGMYLSAVKLLRVLFWAALSTGILTFLFPAWVPTWIPLSLAVSYGVVFAYAALHIHNTCRRHLRCPFCGWIPFALPAWKCKECRFVWDTFETGGVCPSCGHHHAEIACVRCRRISDRDRWVIGN